MLFPEADANHLKKWIVKRLENTSDADADVLADYVLALLRHDGDVQDVRRLCETEIPDFLKEDSSVFVNDVFEAITHKSYLPGAPPPPPRQPVLPQLPAGVAAQFPPGQPVGLPYDDIPLAQPPQFPAFQNQNGSKKRAYGDWSDALDAQTGRDSRYGGRGAKQPRRGAGSGPGSRGGRSEDSNGFKRPGSSSFQQAGLISAGAFPAGVPGNGGWEPNAALEALFNTFASQSQPPRRRARCRDYDTKGYCARGNTCMFEHGDDSIYLPTVPGFGAPESAGQSAAVEEYDPTNALMPNIFNTLPNAQQFGMPDAGHGFRGRGGRGGRHENGPQKRRGKAPFSADGPVFDKTRSTIVVESIPEDHFTEEHVRTFFSQFGNILEVSMQPYKRLAIVKFDSWAAANAAYKSPKVVFDNRFVKVFWYKEDDNSILPPSMPLNGGGSAAGGAKGGSATGTSEADGMTAEPEIDMEEFMRKQEEAQKNHEEKSKKLQEVERQLEEIEKKQQELLARQREEKARLQAKLAQKAKSSRGGSVQSEGDGESSKPSNHSEVLRAQLAKLEAEAEELGIDPHAIVDEPLPDWHAPRGGYAGGYRGRGAPFRARGYAPRAFRGGFRGGRGNHHAAYAAYSLDNRPKKVILTGVDFTESEKDETLRQYLFGVGEFTDIQTTPISTEVTFKDRKTAEKFMNGILLNNKELPGVEGKVEPSWGASGTSGSSSTAVSTPGASHPTSTVGNGGVKVNKQQQQQGDDNNMMTDGGEEGVSGSDDKDVSITLGDGPNGGHQHHHHHHHNDHQATMDYDVADENQWDYE